MTRATTPSAPPPQEPHKFVFSPPDQTLLFCRGREQINHPRPSPSSPYALSDSSHCPPMHRLALRFAFCPPLIIDSPLGAGEAQKLIKGGGQFPRFHAFPRLMMIKNYVLLCRCGLTRATACQWPPPAASHDITGSVCRTVAHGRISF
jgi:hypothetical protein